LDARISHGTGAVEYRRGMRRVAVLLPLLALGVGATAIAQEGPPQRSEPDVAATDVFRLPESCRPGDRVTIRIDPAGAVLASVRVHVAGLEVVRMTGVQGPASATVRIRESGTTRVTATGDTLGGQALYRTRIYGRCATPDPPPVYRPVIGGGED
jgi:hypothetical protein